VRLHERISLFLEVFSAGINKGKPLGDREGSRLDPACVN
jgi:hypothetical protein